MLLPMMAIASNRSMKARALYNADGEMLFVPQQGRHRFVTGLGVIDAEPQEIVVIPRGVRFRLELLDGPVRGYVCENFGANFRLPDCGPDRRERPREPRDFLTPVSAYEDVEAPHELVAKFADYLWTARMDHLNRPGWAVQATRLGCETPIAKGR